jgi:SAM-dependent methyltransferase
MQKSEKMLLVFTNNLESPDFMRSLRTHYVIPDEINYENSTRIGSSSDSFHVFSAMVKGSYYAFHRHDEAQITQIHGRKMWYFLPNDIDSEPPKFNTCDLLHGKYQLRDKKHVNSLISVLQQPGDTIIVPNGWFHATCALDDWTVGVGMQRGSPYMFEQKFDPVPQLREQSELSSIVDERLHPMPWKDKLAFYRRLMSCGVKFHWSHLDAWIWFDDIGKYYDQLIASDSKRNPNDIASYAVHRWMGENYSTLVHYELILSAMQQYTSSSGDNLHVLDAGCGLGAGLMWFETHGPKSMNLVGHTISVAQLKFINNLPPHNFQAVLKSYDDLEDYYNGTKPQLDVIYSIEAFIHSPNEVHTLQQWSKALSDQGLVIIVDDFLSTGVDKNAEDVQVFSKSWVANALHTTTSLATLAKQYNLQLIMDRDLGSEYQINERNYKNQFPDMSPTEQKSHQGWLGSKMRQRLMLQGKLTYRFLVFQKN